ncbi:NADH-quinone oxidoreductase subunit NuoI [bacterium]|nr:NADH-quinone oxidoreductase subunit NuoI [bacterium]
MHRGSLSPTAILGGLKITFAQFMGSFGGRNTVTVQYPLRKKRMQERFRGLHRLERHTEGPYKGLEKCIGCALCAAACPAEVITVVAAENTDDERYSPGERYAKVYDMDMLRCIFCGMCTEACPTEAIVMKHDYELADDSRRLPNKFIYHKEDLLDRPFHW